MKKLFCVLVTTLAIILLALPFNPVAAQTEEDNTGLADAQLISDTSGVLVTFYNPPGSAEVDLIESLGGTVEEVYKIVPTIHAIMPPENLVTLAADPRVKLIEPNLTIIDSATGQVLPWGVDRIDADLVHPTNKGTGIKVAVLDTGIDLDHPDLNVAGNVTFVEGTTTGDDDNGHGTLVAGIMGARDNDIGVIGVAPEATLYAVKVLDSDGSGIMSVLLSGIEWSVNNNMQVMNIGGGSVMNWPTTVRNALTKAYVAGIAIFGGAGNGGTPDGQGENIWAPGRYDSVIAVGATDENNVRLSTSSTGSQLELMAPGNNIYSTAMGGGYGYIGQTSASSAHAAGTAALLMKAGMTSNANVRQTLKDSATDVGAPGWDSQYGWGLMQTHYIMHNVLIFLADQ